jgi:hypothetical protein
LTSELNERRWAVLSEYGREESGLSYEDASRLVARLRAERVSGLCVITDAAAARVPAAKRGARKARAGGDPKPKQGRRKKAS